MAISRSATLGTEVSQLECIEISWSTTLSTEATQPECKVMSVRDSWLGG